MFLAAYLGIRWVINNLGATWEHTEVAAWSEEMIGIVPPDFQGMWGSYASQEQDEALLVFIQAHERGSEVTLTVMFRQGQHDFESVTEDIDTDNENIYVKFDSKAGEAEEFFATWRDVQVPVQLSEGYDSSERLSRQITAIIPIDNHIVAMFFEGNADILDRNIVQEMLDLIPADWQPQDMPTKPD